MNTLPIAVTGTRGPSLPLLYDDGEDYPIYTGPLGVALALVKEHRHLVERDSAHARWGAFLTADNDGRHIKEWAHSVVSAEDALRRVLGVYFEREGYTTTTLTAALRSLIVNELQRLDHTEVTT